MLMYHIEIQRFTHRILSLPLYHPTVIHYHSLSLRQLSDYGIRDNHPTFPALERLVRMSWMSPFASPSSFHHPIMYTQPMTAFQYACRCEIVRALRNTDSQSRNLIFYQYGKEMTAPPMSLPVYYYHDSVSMLIFRSRIRFNRILTRERLREIFPEKIPKLFLCLLF